MFKQWTDDRDMSGARMYVADDGIRCMDLLPDFVREQMPHTNEMIDTDEREAPADPVVWARLFTPASSFTWYVLALDGEDLMYCYVESHMAKEFGYVSLEELEGLRGGAGWARNLGMPAVERDVAFKPQPLSAVKG